MPGDRFADRVEAGRRLGEELKARGFGDDDAIVLGIPRGGVVTAGEVASVLAGHPNIKGISYEYAGGMADGGLPAYKAAGITPSGSWTFRTDEPALGCDLQKLNPPNLKTYYWNTSGNWGIRTALTADMMSLKGFKVPPQIVFPIRMKEMPPYSTCVSDVPAQGSITSLVPLDLLQKMYPPGSS